MRKRKIRPWRGLPEQTGKREWRLFLETTRDKLVSEITESEEAPLTAALSHGALGEIGALKPPANAFAEAAQNLAAVM